MIVTESFFVQALGIRKLQIHVEQKVEHRVEQNLSFGDGASRASRVLILRVFTGKIQF